MRRADLMNSHAPMANAFNNDGCVTEMMTVGMDQMNSNVQMLRVHQKQNLHVQKIIALLQDGVVMEILIAQMALMNR
jgi:hypothetical protein